MGTATTSRKAITPPAAHNATHTIHPSIVWEYTCFECRNMRKKTSFAGTWMYSPPEIKKLGRARATATFDHTGGREGRAKEFTVEPM